MPSGFLDFITNLPRKRMAAGLLLTDPDLRVLLVEPSSYKRSWEIPGGCTEADEAPYRAAAREGLEELGLDLSPGRLLVVDWVPPREGRTEGVMFVYDGGTLDATQAARIAVPPDELKGWAWSNSGEAARLPPLLVRRITEALYARADSSIRYLEDGVRVT